MFLSMYLDIWRWNEHEVDHMNLHHTKSGRREKGSYEMASRCVQES